MQELPNKIGHLCRRCATVQHRAIASYHGYTNRAKAARFADQGVKQMRVRL